MKHGLSQLEQLAFARPVKAMFNGIQTWLSEIPSQCVACELPVLRDNLCAQCVEQLPRIQSVCVRCALPLSVGTLCGPCLLRPPAWHAITCAVPYVTPFDTLITSFKFQGRTPVAKALSALLLEAIQKINPTPPFEHLHERNVPDTPDVIVPVPLHWTRLWKRGFNQADLLARPIGKRLKIPIIHALVRTRPTRAQTLVSISRRKANVSDAFRVEASVKGLHIALIDDVVTTGATATAATRTLLKSGARSVRIWACARARGPHPTRRSRRRT